MIKKVVLKKLFYEIIILFFILLVSVSSYIYIQAKKEIETIREIADAIFNGHLDSLWSLFTLQVILFFVGITSLTFLSIHILRMYEVQRKDALIDHLTETYNRRAIMIGLKKEISRAKRYKHPLSVAMLDIDHFKKYNDTSGHPAGDIALKKFATIIKEEIRDVDTIGRVGGEEFLLVMPETNLKGARGTCERIRKKVEDAKFAGEAKLPSKNFTISIGVANHSKNAKTHQHIINQADKNLYKAKEKRNTVI